MAARVRIPLGLPMKKFIFIISFLLIAACGTSNDQINNQRSGQDDAQVGKKPTGIAESIAKVVCESEATSQNSSTVQSVKESWKCKRDKKVIKFDVYINQAEKSKASSEALALLGTVGSNQTWKDIPILCGETWTMGVVDLKTRDALIDMMNSAGISASTC